MKAYPIELKMRKAKLLTVSWVSLHGNKFVWNSISTMIACLKEFKIEAGVTLWPPYFRKSIIYG